VNHSNNFNRIVQEGATLCVSTILEVSMKARVYVSMKPSVLDPQGQTVRSALVGLGHREIASVRQGKFFEIGLAEGTSRDEAAERLAEIARDVLSNPVIEDYEIEILD
jgi:phosphoribosylformylglycinamidine synthase